MVRDQTPKRNWTAKLNDKKTMLRPLEEQQTDDELIRLICNRDESALDSVIRLYGGQVNAISKRICCDDLEASGVVSEVFWELWQNAAQFRSQRGTLRSYLITMARSRALDRYRAVSSHRKKLNKFMESADCLDVFTRNESPTEHSIHVENANEVHSALGRLPHLQRQTLLLAFFDGLSHREVSDHLGLPLGSVKTHIRNGLLKLRHLLASLREPQEYS